MANEFANHMTQEDRLANYIAGKELQKGSKRVEATEIGNPTQFSGALLNARKQHIGKNPIVPNMADYTNWIYYDRIAYAAGTAVPTQFQLFVVPYNTGGKTKVDTNLSLASQLPQPYWINATHIGFSFLPNTLDLDLVAFLNQSYFEFWVNDKIYSEGPFQAYPGNTGVYGYSTLTNDQGVNNGLPTGVQTMYDLRLPAGINLGMGTDGSIVTTDGLTGINILQSQIFNIKCFLPAGALNLTASTATPNPGTGLTVYVYLHGVLSRSVQ
jgi:hypothetical protein